jgi:hypothetical protein
VWAGDTKQTEGTDVAVSRTITYQDFDIMLAKGEPGTYVARVINSPTGEARHEFRLDEIEPLLTSLKADPNLSEERARSAGSALYRTVFGGAVETAFSGSKQRATDGDEGLRVRLRLSETPELSTIPWEYLYRDADQRFLSLFVDTPIIRYVDLADPVEPLTIKPPLRVLVMIPRGQAGAGLNVDREWDLLQEATAQLRAAGLMELEPLADPSYATLHRALQQRTFHGFHFIGHGGFDETGGFLLFDDPELGHRRVTGTTLGSLIADHDSMRLVVLNACEGARSSPEDTFAGIAQTLVANGIPAVAAMQAEITDRAALQFASEFYTTVSEGMPIDAALTEARKAISGGSTGGVEWGTPALYMRAVDGRIFDVDRPLNLPDRGLSDNDWGILLRRIHRNKVTPIVGWAATTGALPSRQEIADKWADEYEYPLNDSGDLTKVAQYIAVTRDRMLPKEEVATLASSAALNDASDIYPALAALPIPVYITTNFDDLLTQALRNAGKDPTIEVCPWRNPPPDPTVLLPGVVADPTPDQPVVYHLYGHPSEEISMVLTEDDYFDYVVSVSRNRNIIRPRIIEALSGTSLVMLGYRLDDWMFRLLVRGLIAASEASARGFSVAVQLPDDQSYDGAFISDYLRALFKASDQNKLSVYWGSASEFASEFQQRLEAEPS